LNDHQSAVESDGVLNYLKVSVSGGDRTMPEFANHLRSIALVKRFTVAMFVIVALAVPVTGQDRMILGKRQFERDNSGKGAVLCSWSINLSVQARTADCGWARRPVDDAIDEAITAIDDFILANSSLHPTRPMLEDFKRRAAESERRIVTRERYCESRNSEFIRSADPDRIREGVKALLSIPREPVMNPCL
jgi:hypothetical protein